MEGVGVEILIVQPLIPKYVAEFMDSIVENSDINITVLADVQTDNILNQLAEKENKFKVMNFKLIRFGPLVFHKYILGFMISNHKNYDLIILNANPRDLIQCLIGLYLRMIGKKFYIWSNFMRIGPPRIYTNLYFWIMASLASKSMCYSRVGAIHLKNLGIGKDKIRILGTAINEKALLTTGDNNHTLNEFITSNKLEGKKIILQVVRLSKIKKPAIILAAAVELCLNKKMDLVFVLIGEGELFEEIKEQISKLGLEKHVHILGAIYDEQLLSKWFQVASLFIVPTCLGLSLHHAMGYGAVVLTDDSLDCQAPEFELLVDGLNGYTYEEGNIVSLTKKIEFVLANPERMKIISQNAKFTVHNLNTLQAKTNNFLRIINEQ